MLVAPMGQRTVHYSLCPYMNIHTFIISLSCLLGGITLSACHQDSAHETETAEHQDTTHDSNETELTDVQMQTIGLQTEVARRGEFSGVIHVSGEVEAPQAEERTVVATADGIVSFSSPFLLPGAQVGAGKVLVTLDAGKLQDGDSNEKARQEFESAQREYDRASELVKEQIISKRDFEQIRLRYELARTAYAGIAQHRAGGSIQVTSPMSGYVKQCMVRPGDYVTVGQPLFLLTQTKRIQLRADVPGGYNRLLPQIRTAHFRTAGSDTIYRLCDLEGRLATYARSLDSGSSYLPVTFSICNEGDILPGSYAEIWLLTTPRKDVFSVPMRSVIEEQGTNFLYIKEGKNHFRKVEVQLGQNDGIRVEVTAGLKDGNAVVTRGAYELKLASATSAIPAHNHEH